MKKYVIAIVIAFGALFGLSVQAAPLTENTTAIESPVVKSSAVEKIYYRYGWRRSYGSRMYWRGYGWRGYRWGRPYRIGNGYACRLRCNGRRCWRVCW